jgi:hypothetical protein
MSASRHAQDTRAVLFYFFKQKSSETLGKSLPLFLDATNAPGETGEGDGGPGRHGSAGTNLTVAVSAGLGVRVWARRNPGLLWGQSRSDVVAPSLGPRDLGAATNADARFAFAAVQHDTARGLATLTLYAPDRGGGAEGHKVGSCGGSFFICFGSVPN